MICRAEDIPRSRFKNTGPTIDKSGKLALEYLFDMEDGAFLGAQQLACNAICVNQVASTLEEDITGQNFQQ
jgi:hypothetical protein